MAKVSSDTIINAYLTLLREEKMTLEGVPERHRAAVEAALLKAGV